MDRYGNGEEIVLKEVLNIAGRKPSFMNFDRELFTGTSDFAELNLLSASIGSILNMVLFFKNFRYVYIGWL